MKSSPQLSNETLTSGFVHSRTVESENADCFNLNVYEFQEGEDLYGPRSRGYQKPKHMWMAKDQALTNGKPSSPNVVAVSAVTGDDCCTNQDDPSAITAIQSLHCPSPTHVTLTGVSPSTNSSTQGLSTTVSSCTNTSSSVCCPTPPVNGFNMTEGISLCASPGSSEIQPLINVPPKGSLKTVIKTKGSFSGKSNKRNTSRTTHKKLESLSKNVSSSLPETDKLANPMSVPTVEERKSRQIRSARANSSRKNKRTAPDETLTLSLPAISDCSLHEYDSGSAKTPECMMMEHSGKVSPHQNQPRSSKSLPSSPPFISSGLKIRLRRDSAPLDTSTTRGKRSKDKSSSGTFRIVESWCDADAPGGDFSRRARAATGSSTSPTFSLVSGGLRVGDIVWAKLAGYPYWPSQISAIWARTAHQLSQATLLPSSQSVDNSNSLAVLATPTDPSLAAGYTARVDWLAWDQCSYLSCAKLFPFKEAFDKLYNPRTRVKGYAEAVRLAKQFANGTYTATDQTDIQLSSLSPHNKSHSSTSCQLSAPPSTDSQWSAITTPSCSLELPTSSSTNFNPRDTLDKGLLPVPVSSSSDSYLPSQLGMVSAVEPHQFSGAMIPITDPFSSAGGSTCDGSDDKHIELPDLNGMGVWAPLPQLDVSGLGVFHVPTFSEDEEEFDQSIVSQLQLDFSSCM